MSGGHVGVELPKDASSLSYSVTTKLVPGLLEQWEFAPCSLVPLIPPAPSHKPHRPSLDGFRTFDPMDLNQNSSLRLQSSFDEFAEQRLRAA